MSRKEQFEEEYGANIGPAVLSSIAAVARSGRTYDQEIIDEERRRHYAMMANLPHRR